MFAKNIITYLHTLGNVDFPPDCDNNNATSNLINEIIIMPLQT